MGGRGVNPEQWNIHISINSAQDINNRTLTQDWAKQLLKDIKG